jgi:large subunit ribosomal protein L6
MYEKEIEIPEGIKAEVNENLVKISGEKGQLEREFKGLHDVKIVLEGNKLKVSSESERRKVKSLVGTIIAHVRNMIHGVTKGYTYTLKVVYSHFPVTIKVDDANRQVIVQNFLGEKIPRVAKIVGDTKVVAKGADITVTGIEVEDVAQTAANLEQATKIKRHDRKVFQDGIYLATKERGKD